MSCGHIKFILCCLPVLALCTEAFAQEVRQEKLDSTVVIGKTNKSHIRRNADMRFVVDMDLVKGLPKLLGSSDPLRYMQYLPGVQMNAEHDNGIRINGCDHAHNSINLDGIPIYGATHLLGLFSIFTPSHFDKFSMQSGSLVENRLGGGIEMMPKLSVPEKVGASFSAGLMEVEGTLELSLGKTAALYLSARRSYLNLLFGNYLKVDDVPIRYSLTDINLSVIKNFSRRDKLWADFYWGKDIASSGLPDWDTDIGTEWGNLVGGLHWKHDWDRVSLTNSVFYTGYKNLVDVREMGLKMTAPSDIRDITYRAEAVSGKWKWGVSATWREVDPQVPGLTSSYLNTSPDIHQSGLEIDTYVSKDWHFGDRWSAFTFAKAGYYLSPERKSYFGLSPVAGISCNLYRGGTVSLKGEIQRQNLFQTGISNVGLPMEFWLMAGDLAGPQTSMGGSLSYNLDFAGGGYAFSTELYYKKLTNQIEYISNLFDLLEGDFDLKNSILVGEGKNYGATFMFHKKSGSLTGWVSYSIGRSLRRFDDKRAAGWIPSSHERPHEVKAVATYQLAKWDFGGMFVFASGTPFTAPESCYISGGRFMVKYGGLNAARLPEYIRLDLSANFYFHREKSRENGINLSVYNVLGRNNSVFYRISYSNEGDENFFGYNSLWFNLRFMPSVSYFHKF